MCQPVAGPFYRAAGLSYLRYANICADLMRSVLKEPFKTKALQRQAIYFRSSTWKDGKQTPSGEDHEQQHSHGASFLAPLLTACISGPLLQACSCSHTLVVRRYSCALTLCLPHLMTAAPLLKCTICCPCAVRLCSDY